MRLAELLLLMMISMSVPMTFQMVNPKWQKESSLVKLVEPPSREKRSLAKAFIDGWISLIGFTGLQKWWNARNFIDVSREARVIKISKHRVDFPPNDHFS